MHKPDTRNIAAIGVMLAAYAILAVLNVLVKHLSSHYPVVEIAFFRSLFGALPVIVLMPWQGGVNALKTQHSLGHLGRGISGGFAMLFLFWSFHLLPLADAVAIGFATGPIFVALFAVVLLGERVGPIRGMAILVGFIGSGIMAMPGGHDLNPFGVGVALSAAVCFGLAMTGVRALGRTERPVTTVFYFAVISTLMTGALLPWGWATPTLTDLTLLLFTGVLGGAAQVLLTRAYQMAPASVVGPFAYSALLWATLFGWLLWQEWPAAQVIAGAVVVIGAGVFILLDEARARHQSAVE